MPEVVETDGDRALALSECRVELHAQAGDVGAFDRGYDAGRQRYQALLRCRQRTGEELAFSPVQLQRKEQLVPALPRVVRQQCRPGTEIGERRGVGRGRLGMRARNQVELGQLLTFFDGGDTRRATVELIDDVEDRLLPLLERGVL